MNLSGHHRTTLEQLFVHPIDHNVQWRDVRSLLEAVGTVSQEHSGRLRVAVGERSLWLTAPGHHHEHALGTEQVLDVRKLLTDAGITPEHTA